MTPPRPARVRDHWRGAREVAGEVDEELAFHLESRTEELVRAGLTLGEARRQAEDEFGDLEGTRRYCRERDLRAYRRSEWWDRWAQAWRDVRFALRGMRREPVSALATALTLALGIGGATLTYSVLHASLLRGAPFPKADELFLLHLEYRGDRGPYRMRWSYPQFQRLLEHELPFAGVALFNTPAFNLSGTTAPERVNGEIVSASYFATLGVGARFGRTFSADEDAPGGRHDVAIVGAGLGSRLFGGGPSAIGRTLRLNGVGLTVVGVMPEGFAGLSGRAEIWIPEHAAPAVTFVDHLTSPEQYMGVIARFGEGDAARLAPALARLDGEMLGGEPLFRLDGDGPPAERVVATPLGAARVDPARRRTSLLLFGAVGLLLAIVCVNVSALQLARGAGRARELAVRAALGAGRGRIVGQLLAETGVRALAGGALGVLLAAWGIRFVNAFGPQRVATAANDYGQVSEFAEAALDLPVLGFALAASLLATFAAGLLPALRLGRVSPARSLAERSEAGGPRGPMPLLRVLSAGEIALAVVLLTGAALVLRGFAGLHRDPGVAADGVLTFWINPVERTFSTASGGEHTRRILESVAAIPGVDAVSVSLCTPYMASCSRTHLYPAGAPPGAETMVGRHYVAPGHFRALGIPLLRGRAFTEEDDADAPRVTVVSRAAAERFWPGQDALGRLVYFGAPAGDPEAGAPFEVVGVAEDVIYWPPDGAPQPEFYTPYPQHSYAFTMVIVRASVPARSLVPQIREAVRRVDPDLPVHDVETLEERMGAALSARRFQAVALSLFAVVAVTLAAVGVYGSVTLGVQARMREFGVRLALGGRPPELVRMVLRQALRTAGIGVVAGIALALALTRALRPLLADVGPQDPGNAAAAGALLAAVALIATAVPARRAARVDPMRSIRAE